MTHRPPRHPVSGGGRRRRLLRAGTVLWAALSACSPAPAADLEPAAAPAAPATAPSAAALPAAPAAAADGYLAVALPRRTIDVAAQVEGRLGAVDVDVGDRVRAGDRLARVEVRELAEQRNMESAGLTALEAEERRARVAHEALRERYERRAPHRELYSEEEMVSILAQVEEAAAQLESAQARVAGGRAQLAQIEERLRRGSITAPVGGTVVERYLDPGALVRPGVEVVRLISSGGMVVRFAVPPEEAGALRLGQRVRFRTAGLPDGVGATVSRISPQVDVASEMVFMEAAVAAPEAAGALQPGLVGSVVVTGPPRKG